MALTPITANAAPPRRIISLSPASTEIIYDLGLGSNVVGVTAYCSWPPEAKSKAIFDNMIYANMEVIASLRPSLILLSNLNEGNIRPQAERLGYPVVVVYQDDFSQICESMMKVGEACGIAAAALRRVNALRESVREISARARARAALSPRKRVLVVVGRDMDDTSFRRVYVAGPKSFYETLLKEAGASNAVTQQSPYVSVSVEGLLQLDPDIIIELIGENGMTNSTTPKVMAQWGAFTGMRAAREGNVAIIRGDFALRAGPRYPLLLDAFASVIHDGVKEVVK